MKILHVVPTYLPAMRYGGPIHSVHGLCRTLVHAGIDVSVYTTNIDGTTVSDVVTNIPIEVDGVKVSYFQSRFIKRLYYSPQMKISLSNNIDKFDLVHGHSIYLWPTAMAATLCQKHRKPYVLSPRGMLVRKLVNKRNKLIKLLWINLVEKNNFSNASAIHFTSQVEAEDAKEFNLAIRDSFVIPNGVDIEEMEAVEHIYTIEKLIERHTPYILFLGRVNWKKGLDRLIQSLSLTQNVTLLIAGNDEEGYMNHLLGIITKHKLDERVKFLGFVNNVEKVILIRNAKLLLLTSYSENFGNTVLEAMAVGCPVVVTRKVGLARTVEENGSGMVVDGKPSEIAKAINTLLNDENMAKMMGMRGRNAAKNSFSWEQIGWQMLHKYQELTT